MKKERKEKEEVIAAKDRLKQEKDTVSNASVVYKTKICVKVCTWWIGNCDIHNKVLDFFL